MNACRVTLAFLLAGVLAPAAAAGGGFPTADRVQYVLECMADHGGHYEYLYECSCAIDALAHRITYDDYVYLSTVAHAAHMPGERGGELREPSSIREAGKRYRTLQTQAFSQCGIESARH